MILNENIVEIRSDC